MCFTQDGYGYVIMPLARDQRIIAKDEGGGRDKTPDERSESRRPSSLSFILSRCGPEAIGNILPELMARRGYARVQSAAAVRGGVARGGRAAGRRVHARRRPAPRQAGSGCGQFDLDAGIDVSESRAIEDAGATPARAGIKDLRFRVGTID